MLNRKQRTVRQIERIDGFFQKMPIKHSFACECGKKYSNYPALYLHFKRFHKIKISTRLSKQACEVVKRKSHRTFIYYFSNRKSNIVEENFQMTKKKQQYLLECRLQQFLKIKKLDQNQEKTFTEIIGKLVRFSKVSLPKTHGTETKILSELPNLFNQFMLINGRQLEQRKIYGQICVLLLELGCWLKQNNYTEYVVEFNQAPETSMGQTVQNG